MTQADWIVAARLSLLSRQMDELEESQLTPQGKVKYQFSAAGHELPQVLLAQALDHPHDAASVYYRSRPFLLASGMSAAEALAAGMARTNSPSQGRDVGVVFNLPRRTGVTVLPASGDVGAGYTPAAGWAQAIRYYQETLGEADWEGAVAAALGGDGSVASNGFWAALNIVTTLALPYLFFIEDNGYGLSVPSTLQTPGGNIAANLAAFGNLLVCESDGSDPAETQNAIQDVLRHVRAGKGPALLRVCVPRLRGHTYIDNQTYKPEEVRLEEARCDPLPRLKQFLKDEKILDESGWAELEEATAAELDEALAQAEAAPEPAAELGSARKYVFFEGEAPRQGGLRPEGALIPGGSHIPKPSGPRLNLIDAVRRTLEREMALNPRMLVFGEDVGVKGGVHGATVDMQAHFGERRVFDTSLSEDGIIGRAVGMALAGLLPAPEIQFRKYADPAHEQISDAGTLRWRTANNFAAPLVVRIPVGFSRATGDPWHSVTGEAMYAHMPGWRIAFPSNAQDAVGLLRSALRGDDPTFFFEHRALLDAPEARRPYPGDDYCLPFGRANRVVEGEELTVVTWGALAPRCLNAAKKFPGRIDLLDLRTIIPWDRELVLESVARTGKLLVVHEDSVTAGFGAEILAVVASQAFTDLDAPPGRLAMPDMPVPFNVGQMLAVMPGEAQIEQRMQALLEW